MTKRDNEGEEEKARVGTYEDSKFELTNPDLNDAFMAIGRRGAAINSLALGQRYLGSGRPSASSF